jgi:hypothetical protein
MESNYAPALGWLFGLIAIVFAVLFRRRLRQWMANHGFRRTGVSAGNAFLAAQSFFQPRVEYVLRAQQEERAEADTGDPPDPENHRLSPRQPPDRRLSKPWPPRLLK